MNEAQRLRKFTFTAPSPVYDVPIILLAPIIFYLSSRNIIFSVIYSISIAALLITDLVAPLILKFKFGPKRSFLLDVIVIYLALVYYFIIIGIRFLSPQNALMLSITTIPFVRTMVFFTFTERKFFITHALSMVFSIAFSICLAVLAPSFIIFVLPLLVSSLVYSLSSHLFVKISFSSFLKEFSIDPVKIVKELVNTVRSEISYNQVVMNFFEQIYTTLVPREVTVLRATSDAGEFMMVFPYIHPGPLGDLGSSNITGKLQNDHKGEQLMVFHTSTTHDDNCAGNEEVRKISKVLNEKGSSFSNAFEPYFGKYLTFVSLGDGGIFFISPDEPRFDDIKITEGRKIVRKARSLGLKWAVVVDQHNNNMDRPIENTDVSYLMDEVESSVRGRKKSYPLYGRLVTSDFSAKDIGPGGIKFLTLTINDKKIAIILVDGNNMEFETRKRIEDSLHGIDKILVCTTDNHIVNVDGLSVNPVGRSTDAEILAKEIRGMAEEVGDVQALNIERVRRELRLKVAGEHHYEKLNEIIRKSINTAKIAGIAAIIFSFGLSLLIFKLLA